MYEQRDCHEAIVVFQGRKMTQWWSSGGREKGWHVEHILDRKYLGDQTDTTWATRQSYILICPRETRFAPVFLA